jgi:hypothetical protein
VAVLEGVLVWYFAALIGVAVAFTLLSLLRPAWFPPLFAGPLKSLHPYLVQGVAAAATLSPFLPTPGVTKGEFALVIGSCGAYFGVLAVIEAGLRLYYLRATRAALTVAVAVGVWHVTSHGTDALLAVVVVLGAQAVAVAFTVALLEAWIRPAASESGEHRRTNDGGPQVGQAHWRRDALIMFGLQLAAAAAFAVAVIAAGFFSQSQKGAIPVPL